MMRSSRLLLGLVLMLVGGPVHARAAAPLRKVADVPLPGRAVRFDYASLDSSSGLLWMNHMGDGDVVVFDTHLQKGVAVLHGFPRCTGILAVPELRRVFVSAAGTGELCALDSATRRVLARLPAAGFPDGIAYEPGTKRIFVSEEAGRAVTAIDAVNLRVLGRVALGGEAGNTQVDPDAHRVYTNDQTDGELVVIDPAKLAVEKRIPLGLKGNHGLLLDLPRHLAFIASEDTDTLLVLDLAHDQVQARFPLGGGPDVLAFDPGLRRLYVASESGKVSVFQETAGGVQKLGDPEVGPNAHVVVVDPASHRLYLPLKSVRGRPLLRILEPVPAPGR